MKEGKSSILLVEGKDDKHVIWSLLEHYNVPEWFKVIDCDGIDNLIRDFSLRMTTPTMYKTIGVVMDADENLKGRYDAFAFQLENTGKYDLKNVVLSEHGTVITSSDSNYPAIGLWLMPNNSKNGMLEDFVLALAEENDAVMKEADAVLKSIEDKAINKYSVFHRSKAKIHTYLAWQEEPGRPMGQAITAKVLNAEAKSASVFIDWIKRLFITEQ